MTCYTLGPSGTFSHELAARIFGDDIDLVPTIGCVFTRVVEGMGTGLVPLENSEAGGVGQTLDGFFRNRVFITGEYYYPVRYVLATPGPEPVHLLFAHPQAYEQCSVYLDSLCLPVEYTESNAASARASAGREGSAAVIPVHLSEVSGFCMIQKEIENQADNTTRFVTINHIPEEVPVPSKCSLLIDPEEDRAGLLYDILGVFARNRVNLTRIESRPSKRKMGQYVFFIDLEPVGPVDGIIEELRTMSCVRELGCYCRKEI